AAGGDFVNAGGSPVYFVAHWNGSAWVSIDNGMDSPVYTLTALPTGELIAGGLFTSAGGVPANRIARWNGMGWQPYANGMDGAVSAPTVFANGDVGAGGLSTNAGGTPAGNAARWLTLVPPVSIESPPASMSVCPGGQAAFSVVAAGGAPVTYH